MNELNRLNYCEQPLGDPDRTLVTIAAGINELCFTDPTGQQELHEPVEVTTQGGANLLGEKMAELYLQVGSGETALTEAAVQTGIYSRTLLPIARKLAQTLPPDLFTFSEGDNTSSMNFGNMSIASRRVSEEERAAYRVSKLDREGREILAADAEKTNLMLYDHAITRVQEKRYILTLDTPEAIMAARMLHSLSLISQDSSVVRDLHLTRAVWESMPIVERELFSDEDRFIYRDEPTSAFRKQVKEAITGLASRLGLTRRGETEAQYRILTPNTDTTFELEPLPEVDPSLRVLFPPGTPTHVVEQHKVNTELVIVTDEERAFAQTILTTALRTDSPRTLPTVDAVAILDTIMSRSGKKALSEALQDNHHRLTLAGALSRLHTIVQDTLGMDNYRMSIPVRVIAGRSHTGDSSAVVQNGGRASIALSRFNRGTDAAYIKRWFIGEEVSSD